MSANFRKTKVSTICVMLLLQFSGIIYGNNKIDSCLQELALYEDEPLSLPYANLLHELGKVYLYQQDYKLAKSYFQQSLEGSKELKEETLLIKNYAKLAIVSFWLSKYEEAINYSLEPIENYAHLLTADDSLGLFKNLAHAYHYEGNLEAAYVSLLTSLNISIHQGDALEIAESYCKLAEISKDQKVYPKAIEHAKKALAIIVELNKPYDESFCYDLLGEIYHLMGAYEQALTYKIKSCQVGKELFNAYDSAYCDYTIAETQVALGNYELAQVLLKSAIKEWKKMGFHEEQIKTQLVYAQWYLAKGNCTASTNLVRTCLQLANQEQNKRLLKKVYHQLYYTAQQCNQPKVALEAYQQYLLYRDSINGNATQKAIANLSATHELRQHKQALTLLQTQQKLQKTYYISLLILSIFLVLCIIVIIRYLKKQYEYNSILKGKNKEIQQQNLVLEATNIELIHANEQLEKANHDLERFAYIVSHDLRSPLRTVDSFTGLIEKKYKSLIDEEGKTYIDFILNGVKHMSQLLEDILLFSRAKRAPLKRKTVDLNRLLKQLIQVLHAPIKEKNAQIIIGDIPPVIGSSSQLGQVFQNIIENALKFIPTHRQPIIQIAAELDGEQCRISIRDNGIGIKPDHQEKVFSIFQRLHSTKEYTGTGLGLAICQAIIQRHEGKIWIESDGKNGTTFYFTLNLDTALVSTTTAIHLTPELSAK